MPALYMVRYYGTRFRRHVVQRRDGLFWGGGGWVRPVGGATLYRLVRDAQAQCVRLQRQLTDGKPRREFRCSFVVSVIADDVAGFTVAEVADYVERAVNVSVDYEAEGDGPVAGGYVECLVKLAELKEVVSRKRKR